MEKSYANLGFPIAIDRLLEPSRVILSHGWLVFEVMTKPSGLGRSCSHLEIFSNKNGESERRQRQDMSGCSKAKLWDISTVIVCNCSMVWESWTAPESLVCSANPPTNGVMFSSLQSPRNVQCEMHSAKYQMTSAGSRSRHILNIASATPFFCQQSPKCWFWLFRHERITRSLCKLDQRPSLWIRSFKQQALALTVSSFDTRML